MLGRKNRNDDEAGDLEGRIIAWRRHLHAHPEISGEEHETTRKVMEFLRGAGLEPVQLADTGCFVEVGEGPLVSSPAAVAAVLRESGYGASTMTVLADMKTAPSAGVGRMPDVASTPALQ